MSNSLSPAKVNTSSPDMRRLQINPSVNIFAMKQSSENTNELLWTCRITELHYQKGDAIYSSVSEAEEVAEAQSLNKKPPQKNTTL